MLLVVVQSCYLALFSFSFSAFMETLDSLMIVLMKGKLSFVGSWDWWASAGCIRYTYLYTCCTQDQYYFDYISNHPVIPQTLLGCLGCLCSQTRVVWVWSFIMKHVIVTDTFCSQTFTNTSCTLPNWLWSIFVPSILLATLHKPCNDWQMKLLYQGNLKIGKLPSAVELNNIVLHRYDIMLIFQ